MPRKRHCKTCRCGIRLKRHVCHTCGTRKLEKFMQPTGVVGPFGRKQWRCAVLATCTANPNYGQSGYLISPRAAAALHKPRSSRPRKRP